MEIAPKAAAEGADQTEQPPVRAVLEQDAVPLVVELDAAGDVAAGLLQPPDDVGQPLEPLGARIGRLVERQRLQRGQDGADLPQLGRIERGQAKAPPCLGRQQAFAGEAEEGLADRGPADAKLGGDGGIAELGAGRQVPAECVAGSGDRPARRAGFW